ncbi:MAG: efflux RND transporter periplasmic adaptor subunit [Candidatus Riflebacteria bacterium]|nr:efflux RND transporter periplasmic adaptor subunit [Candidatus Riflebacteria bacterium]
MNHSVFRRFVFFLLLFALLESNGCQTQTSDSPKIPTPVTVRTVTDKAQAVSLKYSGTIEPGTIAPVAFRTGGYVKEIASVVENGIPRLVQTGDHVASGSVLAQVEDREFNMQISRAKSTVLEAQSGLLSTEAQVAAARNSAQQARDEYSRAKRLFKTDSITRVEFDTAQTSSRNADEALAAALGTSKAVRAKIQAAQSLVSEVESVTHDTAVRSPLDGFLLSRNIEPGCLAGPGTVAFVVAQMDPLKIRFAVPDRLLDKVTPGVIIEASLDFRPDCKICGKVSKIGLAADPKTRLFDVEVTVPKPEPGLKPGMVVQIEFNPTSDPYKGLIPLEAIVPGNSGENTFAVFQVNNSGGKKIAVRKEVKLGRPFGNLISVESGILPGEQIIVSGAAFLEDGDLVHVVEDSL